MPRSCFWLLSLLWLPCAAVGAPSALWTFDGADVASRCREAYGNTALQATEVGGTSAWNTRAGFGDVLANGTSTTYLKVANAPVLDPGSGSFSWSMWVYRTSDDANSAALLDALSGATTSGWQWFFQGNDTLRLRLDDTAGNTVNVDTTGSYYVLNTWQHFAFTVDRLANRARIYVNGAEATPAGGVNIAALTGAITPDQDLFIGSLNGATAARGRLDDVAFFKSALSKEEIASMAGNGGTPALAVWPAGAPLVISPASGRSRAPVTVSFSGGTNGGELRYTLDGSLPTTSSLLYTGPFEVSSSMQVRARSFLNGGGGQEKSASYAILPPTIPNVVLIIGDDIGYNDLGCYGSANVATPWLDSLAYKGQRFTQFTTAGPGDVASQYALLTGRVARRGGLSDDVVSSFSGMDAREWTLAEAYRKQGLQTAFVGAWHLGSRSGSKAREQGFSLFYGLPTARSTSPALVENETVIDAVPAEATLLNRMTTRAEEFLEENRLKRFLLVFQPPSVSATGSSLLGDYGNRVEAFDTSVGRLMQKIETLGLSNDTLFLFVSDSGADRSTGVFPQGSNGQMRDGKGTTWEGGVRVPAIVRWDGVVPAGVNQSLVWLPDLFPTLVELTQAYPGPERPMDGSDQSLALFGAQVKPDASRMLFLERNQQTRAVRAGAWKLHLSYNNSDSENDISATAPLLYQVEQDPIEWTNRVFSMNATVAALQSLASAHEATFSMAVPQLPPIQPPFVSEVASAISAQGGPVTFSFLRPLDSLDDQYVIEWSDNLTHWSSLAIGPYVIARDTIGANERISLSLDPAQESLTGNSHFFRLRATRPTSP